MLVVSFRLGYLISRGAGPFGGDRGGYRGAFWGLADPDGPG